MEKCAVALDELYMTMSAPFEEREIQAAMREVIEGMKYLHKKGIMHRGIFFKFEI